MADTSNLQPQISPQEAGFTKNLLQMGVGMTANALTGGAFGPIAAMAAQAGVPVPGMDMMSAGARLSPGFGAMPTRTNSASYQSRSGGNPGYNFGGYTPADQRKVRDLFKEQGSIISQSIGDWFKTYDPITQLLTGKVKRNKRDLFGEHAEKEAKKYKITPMDFKLLKTNPNSLVYGVDNPQEELLKGIFAVSQLQTKWTISMAMQMGVRNNSLLQEFSDPKKSFLGQIFSTMNDNIMSVPGIAAVLNIAKAINPLTLGKKIGHGFKRIGDFAANAVMGKEFREYSEDPTKLREKLGLNRSLDDKAKLATIGLSDILEKQYDVNLEQLQELQNIRTGTFSMVRALGGKIKYRETQKSRRDEGFTFSEIAGRWTSKEEAEDILRREQNVMMREMKVASQKGLAGGILNVAYGAQDFLRIITRQKNKFLTVEQKKYFEGAYQSAYDDVYEKYISSGVDPQTAAVKANKYATNVAEAELDIHRDYFATKIASRAGRSIQRNRLFGTGVPTAMSPSEAIRYARELEQVGGRRRLLETQFFTERRARFEQQKNVDIGGKILQGLANLIGLGGFRQAQIEKEAMELGGGGIEGQFMREEEIEPVPAYMKNLRERKGFKPTAFSKLKRKFGAKTTTFKPYSYLEYNRGNNIPNISELAEEDSMHSVLYDIAKAVGIDGGVGLKTPLVGTAASYLYKLVEFFYGFAGIKVNPTDDAKTSVKQIASTNQSSLMSSFGINDPTKDTAYERDLEFKQDERDKKETSWRDKLLGYVGGIHKKLTGKTQPEGDKEKPKGFLEMIWDGLKNVFLKLGGFIWGGIKSLGGLLGKGLSSVGGWIGKFLGSMGRLILNPIALTLGLGIAGTVWAISSAWDAMKTEGWGGFFKQLFLGDKEGGLTSAFKTMGPYALAGAGAGSLFFPGIGTIIGGLVGAGIGGLVGYFGQDKMIEFGKSIHKWALGGVIADWMGWKENSTARTFANWGAIIPWTGPLIFGSIGAMVDLMTEIFDQKDESKSFMENIWQNIKDKLAGFVSGLFDFLVSSKDWIKEKALDLGGNIYEGFKSLFKSDSNNNTILSTKEKEPSTKNRGDGPPESGNGNTASGYNLDYSAALYELFRNQTGKNADGSDIDTGTGTNGSAIYDPSVDNIQPPTKGSLVWPSKWSGINSPFGPRKPESTPGGMKMSSYHKGIDIQAGLNDPIFAAKAGKVMLAGGPYGTVEVLHDDGTKTRYLHLSKIRVKSGDKINAGDVVGLAGGRGPMGLNSYKPHLHFEYLEKDSSGQYVKKDPEALFYQYASKGLGKTIYNPDKPSYRFNPKERGYAFRAKGTGREYPQLAENEGKDENSGGPMELDLRSHSFIKNMRESGGSYGPSRDDYEMKQKMDDLIRSIRGMTKATMMTANKKLPPIINNTNNNMVTGEGQSSKGGSEFGDETLNKTINTIFSAISVQFTDSIKSTANVYS